MVNILTFLIALSVLERAKPVKFPEHLGKVPRIFESDFSGNFMNLLVAVDQILFCFLHADIGQGLIKGDSDFLLEQTHQMIGVDVISFRIIFNMKSESTVVKR